MSEWMCAGPGSPQDATLGTDGSHHGVSGWRPLMACSPFESTAHCACVGMVV